MENKDIKLIKYFEINNQESAVEIYKNMKQAYLELRLSSKHGEIKNYVGQKNIMKKNIARALTYLSQNSLDNVKRKVKKGYEK
jgi:ribosomal protein L29